MPRELADLPYAEHLSPFRGRLEREQGHDSRHFDGGRFEDADCGGSTFLECAFSSVTFTGGRFRRARFNDVWLHAVRWVGTDLVETDWLDAEVDSAALAGVQVFGARLRRVTFHNCKFDSVNVRGAHLRDVAFVDCLLRDVDLSGAVLTGVDFPGSTLERVRFGDARMAGVDLRDAAGLDIEAGHEALRGATISSAQLLDLAPVLAQALGIAVRDR
ncbi:pentapeptide repeat-containing protein [Streptomyces sp. TP-A0874]|uniref:pentapeptide repeat-containing protein n=1 Tax=Streptomyces sp. TP-A0874 TaxID=549819 RepID=UPI000853E752|nr:pentapeptide repeat-containing protein [Streptomyces sp. TP-A0874]